MAKKHSILFVRDIARSAPNRVYVRMQLPYQQHGHFLEMCNSDWKLMQEIAADSNGRIEIREEK